MDKHEYFKQNYKFINFEKSTTSTNSLNQESNESIKEFYQDLIEINLPCQTESLIIEVEKKSIQIKSQEKPKYKSKDFLKAAQKNDLDFIIKYSNSSSDLLVVDDFKWNALMISIAAGNNEIVKYLLNNIKDTEVVKKLLENKDSSGNCAQSLAVKFRNKESLDLIENFKKNLNKSEKESEIIEEESNEEFYCESCKKIFISKDQSHLEHITSIVHQLNQNDQDKDKKRKLLANYHLRRNNKGYQLMLKSSWNESGLGLNEQGRINPIKSKIKLDRFGFGFSKPGESKGPALKPQLVKLKKNKSDTDINSMKSLKEMLKQNKKAKNFEKNMRRYFDI